MRTYLLRLLRRLPLDFALTAVAVLTALGLMQSIGRGWSIAAGICALLMVSALSRLTMRTERDER